MARENTGKINFHIRTLDDPTRDRLQSTFNQLEHRLGMNDLGYTLFYAVLELVGNAVRANIKRLYFKEKGYDFACAKSYESGIMAFRREMISVLEIQYARELEELNFIVDVDID